MYELEILMFLVFGFFSVIFFRKWYNTTFNMWPPQRMKASRYIFGWLPIVALIIILYTLKSLASFDVLNDFFYILFYILMGFAWLYFGLIIMAYYFDISWIDDALNLNNKAALLTITGGALGITVIFSGANIGDGPGWWCVAFAGGLGLIAFIILGRIVNRFTNIFERITIERDTSSGIRFGFYLLAVGIILGRASAGDWTSFNKTIIEFMDGWPALLLTIFYILVESYYKHQSKVEYNIPHNNIYSSVFWGVILLIGAIVSIIILPPLKENPMYNMIIIFNESGGLL